MNFLNVSALALAQDLRSSIPTYAEDRGQFVVKEYGFTGPAAVLATLLHNDREQLKTYVNELLDWADKNDPTLAGNQKLQLSVVNSSLLEEHDALNEFTSELKSMLENHEYVLVRTRDGRWTEIVFSPIDLADDRTDEGFISRDGSKRWYANGQSLTSGYLDLIEFKPDPKYGPKPATEAEVKAQQLLNCTIGVSYINQKPVITVGEGGYSFMNLPENWEGVTQEDFIEAARRKYAIHHVDDLTLIFENHAHDPIAVSVLVDFVANRKNKKSSGPG